MPTKLTKSIIAAAEPRKSEYFIWDTEVRKFGAALPLTAALKRTVGYRPFFCRSASTAAFSRRPAVHGVKVTVPLSFASLLVPRPQIPKWQKTATPDGGLVLTPE